jgi:hypothetical protein
MNSDFALYVSNAEEHSKQLAAKFRSDRDTIDPNIQERYNSNAERILESTKRLIERGSRVSPEWRRAVEEGKLPPLTPPRRLGRGIPLWANDVIKEGTTRAWKQLNARPGVSMMYWGAVTTQEGSAAVPFQVTSWMMTRIIARHTDLDAAMEELLPLLGNLYGDSPL